MSKHLAHPNIVSLLGATIDPLELVSDWMPGGDLPAYIAKYPDTNRLSLVRFFPTELRDALTPVLSYLTLPKASTTSIRAMWSMEISRE
jgi:hypothetical protein